MVASSRFANVSDEKIGELNISAVPKSTQYATKYGVKIFKGKTASLILLVYLNLNKKHKYRQLELVNRLVTIITL